MLVQQCLQTKRCRLNDESECGGEVPPLLIGDFPVYGFMLQDNDNRLRADDG